MAGRSGSSRVNVGSGSEPVAAEAIDEVVDAVRMSFGEHLEELRGCLIRALVGVAVCALVSLVFARRILVFILKPAVVVLQAHGESPNLLALSPAAPFILYLKVGCLSGLVVAMPWVLYQAWRFVSSGLYARERRFAKRFVPVSAGLFAAGVAFMFYIVLPIVLNFFVTFADALDLPELHPNVIQRLIAGGGPAAPRGGASVTPQGSPAEPFQAAPVVPIVSEDPTNAPVGTIWFNSVRGTLNIRCTEGVRAVPLKTATRVRLVSARYGIQFVISLVFALAIGFGLAFELPIVVVFLAAMGLVSTAAMARARRYVLFGIVVAAAVMTPPDVVSQILLAVPMYVLFESGLLVARGFERTRTSAA